MVRYLFLFPIACGIKFFLWDLDFRDLSLFDGTCFLTSDKNVLFQKSVAETTFGASIRLFQSAF